MLDMGLIIFLWIAIPSSIFGVVQFFNKAYEDCIYAVVLILIALMLFLGG